MSSCSLLSSPPSTFATILASCVRVERALSHLPSYPSSCYSPFDSSLFFGAHLPTYLLTFLFHCAECACTIISNRTYGAFTCLYFALFLLAFPPCHNSNTIIGTLDCSLDVCHMLAELLRSNNGLSESSASECWVLGPHRCRPTGSESCMCTASACICSSCEHPLPVYVLEWWFGRWDVGGMRAQRHLY